MEAELDRVKHVGIKMTDALAIQKTVVEGDYLEFLGYCCTDAERVAPFPAHTDKNHVKVVGSFLKELTGRKEPD